MAATSRSTPAPHCKSSVYFSVSSLTTLATFIPAFSASVRGTTSSASANYPSPRFHVSTFRTAY